MRIDSHQHFWQYSQSEYPWIPAGSTLERSYLPADLLPNLRTADLDACIAVQARQSLKENTFLTELAAQCESICGVVGWIDLRSSDVERQADEFSRLPKAVGVRHVVQDESDPDFMLHEPFRKGITSLHKHQLVYDILIYENQLVDAIRLVRDFPNQVFVLDHIAKPKIKSGEIKAWHAKIEELAHYPNVSVKLSGMLTEADHHDWKVEQLTPYWEVVLQAFGPNRILYGSDWPVLLLAGQYVRWVEIVAFWLERLSQSERANIWGKNAARIYLRK